MIRRIKTGEGGVLPFVIIDTFPSHFCQHDDFGSVNDTWLGAYRNILGRGGCG